jgi:hypothetical protein
MRRILIMASLALLASCASVSDLPQSAGQAFQSTGEIGRTGWSRYQDVMFVRGIDRQTAFLAAREGLASASFTIQRGSEAEGTVIGARGMTAYDWNVVAGVYFQERGDGFEFSVVAQGSRDIGFWGDHTASSWPQDIFRGLRNYVATEASIANPDRGVFEMRPSNK